MADDADLSDKRIEDAIMNGIEAAQIAARKPVEYLATCKWCGDDTDLGARYCCGDCSRDHQKYEAALKRNGVERG